MINTTTYIDKITDYSTARDAHFEQVLKKIKDDSHLKEKKERLLALNGERRQEYKRFNFPCFFPGVWLRNNDENKLCRLSLATGLVQFDIDVKDNEITEEMKQAFLSLPELYYLFESPNGGIKLAIRTDFYKTYAEDIRETKERYRKAYKVVKAYLLSKVNVNFDDAVGYLKSPCFLSYDPNAYFNEDSQIFPVNDQCFYSSCNPKEPLLKVDTHDKDYIIDMLYRSNIPRNLNEQGRQEINSAAFNALGETAEGILIKFWDIDPELKRHEIKNKSVFRNRLPLGIGFLMHMARKYDYPLAARGKARQKLTTNVILLDNERMGELKSMDEAQDMIREEITNFFSKKEDVIISSSVGIGKSEFVLNLLKQIPFANRVLYVSNNHDLLEELANRYKEIPTEKMKSVFPLTHIRGKSKMCIDEGIKKLYGSVPIPYKQCYECIHEADCPYTDQFRTGSNIRLVVADELFNEEAYFNNFKPDFIIIDESCLKLETFQEDLMTVWPSIRNIILDCHNMSLEEAMKNNLPEVIKDYSEMKRQRVAFQSGEQYVNDLKKLKPQSEILKAITESLMNDELKGLRRVNNSLRLSRVRTIHDRFEGVPKLLLDATANEKIIKHIFPEMKFVSVHAQKKATTKVIQAENFNLTKSKLEKKGEISRIVQGLKELIKEKGYKNVGLITYKNLQIRKDFDQWLGNEIGASVIDHFGNIRGTNKFSHVDCLFIVGRHLLDRVGLDDWSYAIFNKEAPTLKETEILRVPVRMPNQFVSIENIIYLDPDIEALKNHLCQSETMQALGRCRWFNDTVKDVYLFSNESLGTDYIVDSWIRYEHVFKKKVIDSRSTKEKKQDTYRAKMQEQRERLLEQRDWPSVEDTCESFVQLGFLESFSKYKRNRHEFMLEAGYRLNDKIWTLNRD